MSEIWELLVVGYFIVMGVSLLMMLLKLLIPHLIFSIDEVCDDKMEICNCVINYMENEMGVKIQNLTINFDYSSKNEYRGYYEQNTHSVKLYHENLDNVHSWIITLIEEIHHSIFVSTKSGVRMYELYDRKVGYDNNPLEYAAKLYAVNNFRTIHRILKKQGLIRYKV